MMMIGLGGANLLNKAGHEALGWERNEDNGLNTGNRSVRYRAYADEPLNPRISGPILQGNNLIATIDHVPCTIQLPEKWCQLTMPGHCRLIPLPMPSLPRATVPNN